MITGEVNLTDIITKINQICVDNMDVGPTKNALGGILEIHAICKEVLNEKEIDNK